MSKRTRLLVLMSGFGLVLALGLWLRLSSMEPREDIREFTQAAQLIQPLHERKRPPESGDWLGKYAESGQSFSDYVDFGHNIPTQKKRTIYVVGVGEFSSAQDQLIDSTTAWLEVFLCVPTKRLPNVPLGDVPAEARRGAVETDDEQLLATHLIDERVLPQTPPDALAMLGLTTFDVWPGGAFNFTFGLALGDRGLVSFHRLGSLDGSADEQIESRRRVLKVAVHEVGHMLGMPHCTAYECRMNGGNNRRELDRQASWFCPECEAKIWWATGCDRQQRYRDLADFADRHELRRESEFWRRSAAALKRGQ